MVRHRTARFIWGARRVLAVAALLAAGLVVAAVAPIDVAGLTAFRAAQGLAARPEGIEADDWERWVQAGAGLQASLEELRLRGDAAGLPVPSDLLADAGALWRNLLWMFRYEEALVPADAARIERALAEGQARAAELTAGTASWTTRRGRLLRGFISALDGSYQPYGIVVPLTYDPTRSMRLDVVLHGSIRPRGGVALRWGDRFVASDAETSPDAATDFIELHPFGRGENGYRWAGETDIFEAIEAVCRQYAVDRTRIVLRGFSMGASGTWHVGLKHPDRFAALGPYCGYVDTFRFSASPNPRFVRVADLPPHQEGALRLNDAIGYAANAGVVPVVAAMGELDPGFVNHAYMEEAFAAEGLHLVNLVAPGTAHRIDPATQSEQLRQIAARIDTRPAGAPRTLRFVTWSLKYARCHWLVLRELERHYARAEIAAELGADGVIRVTALRNIVRFVIDVERLGGPPAGLEVLGERLALPAADRPLEIVRGAAGWHCAGPDDTASAGRKRPGLQGPIDDAFTAPFLCVRGTGTPWHPEVAAWAEACLRRFAHEWARYMGGELPVKNDTEVTEEDLRSRHLILFGDPGSNRWIREALPGLPLEWTRDTVGIHERAPAATHAPVLICASPLPGAQDRYLVLNRGHTFHEPELATLNYLLFPRLGDWALVETRPGAAEWRPGAAEFPERVREAGFFDEHWRP